MYNLQYTIRISLVSAMGGLLFGYDWVVIGGAKVFYEQFFTISEQAGLQGWAVSSALVGCILGTILSGYLSQKRGKKSLLILSALLFFISAVGTGLANDFNWFILYRIIGGIGIGLASNISPVYIAEIAPADIRGRLVSINQLTIVIGVLLAQIVNWQIADPVAPDATGTEILNSWNGQTGWRMMFWAEAVPALLFFVMMWFVPESPRWLMQRGKEDEAGGTLLRIGGKSYALQTVEEIRKALQDQSKKIASVSLLSRKVFPIVLIGVVLAFFQQWCGINVIFLYAQEVFTSAGYSVSGMLLNVVITGTVNLIFTVLAMFLIDKIGRKKLLLIGAGGLTIIYLLVGIFYYTEMLGLPLLILIVAAIACYALTLAPVTWVVLSEIFPNKIRGKAMAVATFSLWTGNTLLAFLFPIINKGAGAHGSFLLFAAICAAGFFFIKQKVTETKGKSLEELESELTIERS